MPQCHIVYSPALLPRAPWRRVIGGLGQHFGEDASVDPVVQADILRFLEANAADSGTGRVGSKVMQRIGTEKAPLRITETRWFVRRHDDVARATWARESIGFAANCAACRRQAERGAFEENDVRIPK